MNERHPEAVGWVRAHFRREDGDVAEVWAEVKRTKKGEVREAIHERRVRIRFDPGPGANIYPARSRFVDLHAGAEVEDLPDGVDGTADTAQAAPGEHWDISRANRDRTFMAARNRRDLALACMNEDCEHEMPFGLPRQRCPKCDNDLGLLWVVDTTTGERRGMQPDAVIAFVNEPPPKPSATEGSRGQPRDGLVLAGGAAVTGGLMLFFVVVVLACGVLLAFGQ